MVGSTRRRVQSCAKFKFNLRLARYEDTTTAVSRNELLSPSIACPRVSKIYDVFRAVIFGEIFNANVVSTFRGFTLPSTPCDDSRQRVADRESVLIGTHRSTMDFKQICLKNTEEKNETRKNEKTNKYACFRFVGEVRFATMNWLETRDCS